MHRIAGSRLIVFAILVSAAMTSPVQGGSSFMYQVTAPGLVSTVNVNDVGSPVSSYQISGLTSSDNINAASYDHSTNRLYYVDNLTKTNQAQLEYVQLNATGTVVGQTTVGILPSQVTVSFGADYYDGRVWINQNDTNKVYGFDPNNLSSTPITLTLPTPSGHPNTQFNLGDLTFNDATKQMFIAGNLNGGSGDDFVYKYQLNGTGTPSLIASRDYTASNSDPRFNGIIFNQDTNILYGYYNITGQLYTIDTSTLTVASDVGSNPALFENGDLAGFSAFAISVPEPSSVIGLGTGMLILLTCRLIRMRIAAVI
jgi:hypothetical protein